MIRLQGRFDVIPDEWRDIEYIMSLMGRTSMQELPTEIKKHSKNFSNTDEIRRTWLVLKNSSPKFIRSVAEEENTIDRPYDVTDEMKAMLKNFWFTSNKDLYLFSGGNLYGAQLVRNYLSEMMKKEHDMASLVIGNDSENHFSQNIYTRTWAYYLMLSYRDDIDKVITDKKKIKQIITLENVL